MKNRTNPRASALLRAAALLLSAFTCRSIAAELPPTAEDSIPREFRAAMQRIRQRLPEQPDSPGLIAYVIHDYLVAARLRRNLSSPSEELDGTIDDFLHSHSGQPVIHGLKHDWLQSLADRKRWDWFLPRSADATDPLLICDRLAGRLATGDTAGLAQEALARWMVAQKQPDECNAVFAWLHTQSVLTPELADSRTRAALAADNPRLARDFVGDVPAPRSAPLLQWIQLLESPNVAVSLLSMNPGMPVEPDALVAGFSHLSIVDSTASWTLLPALLKRPD